MSYNEKEWEEGVESFRRSVSLTHLSNLPLVSLFWPSENICCRVYWINRISTIQSNLMRYKTLKYALQLVMPWFIWLKRCNNMNMIRWLLSSKPLAEFNFASERTRHVSWWDSTMPSRLWRSIVSKRKFILWDALQTYRY